MNIEKFYKKDWRKIKNPTEDFIKGKDDREIWAAVVNNNGAPHGIRVNRIHSFLRNMSASEKKTNNTLVNRIIDAGMDTAMGLDYILQAEYTSKQRIISFRRRTDPDLFYKIPSDPGFIESVLSKVLFVFINHPHISKYATIEGSEVNWRLSSSRTNKNRISAYIKETKAIVRPRLLTYRNIEGIAQAPSLLQDTNYNLLPLIGRLKKALT